MHAIYAAVLALAATCASAASTSTGPHASATFKLRASSVGTDDLRGWPIQHAHVSAGEDLLILQRPTAFTASDAFLNGTLRQDKNDMQRLAFGE